VYQPRTTERQNDKTTKRKAWLWFPSNHTVTYVYNTETNKNHQSIENRESRINRFENRESIDREWRANPASKPRSSHCTEHCCARPPPKTDRPEATTPSPLPSWCGMLPTLVLPSPEHHRERQRPMRGTSFAARPRPRAARTFGASSTRYGTATSKSSSCKCRGSFTFDRGSSCGVTS